MKLLPDKKLNELYEKIKPVIGYVEIRSRGKTNLEKRSDGDLYYIKEVDLKGCAYTWDPNPTKPAYGLEELDEITTYHTYGYHGFFKPSIAEVLSQIPKGCLDEVVAFQTLTDSADISGEYHAATTVLYRRQTEEEINQTIENLVQQREILYGGK
jgi:hypothetical protein